ncbi:MAG: pyridoxamine 5'-phosphate oxidase family protein [Candidatus Pacebacteria bacterium]|jgi:general stress protein 26|nr:pyridoxamine 5'-phosphate oxidase family protein [Candidatus Paceibacterota bacterium]
MDIPEDVRDFLKKNTIGVISTRGSHGMESAAVYYTFDDGLHLYFNTRTNSTKFENIKEQPEVTFVVYSTEPAQTLQMTGIAEEIEELNGAKDIYIKLLEQTLKGKTAPIETLHSNIRFIKITPKWARFGDFSGGISIDPFTTLLGTSRPH